LTIEKTGVFVNPLLSMDRATSFTLQHAVFRGILTLKKYITLPWGEGRHGFPGTQIYGIVRADGKIYR
jgi:hypothetical protein